ncbi:MAG: FHA domain-containing protein [Acidimicrobiales bacterium]
MDYVFLALLYLFLLRVVRAVWVELREPRLVPTPPGAGADASAPALAATGPGGGRGRASPTRLVLVEPDEARGTSFALEGELTIGRAPGCAVALPSDTFVSQLHARVFRRGDDYWVEDLGSTNGTLVNGRKLDGAVPLRRGDRVQVGRSVLELQR